MRTPKTIVQRRNIIEEEEEENEIVPEVEDKLIIEKLPEPEKLPEIYQPNLIQTKNTELLRQKCQVYKPKTQRQEKRKRYLIEDEFNLHENFKWIDFKRERALLEAGIMTNQMVDRLYFMIEQQKSMQF